MKKILILASGINSLYHFSQIAKKKFANDFYLIGTDINEPYLVSSINYLDKFYKVSPAKEPGYYNEILEILDKEKPNYILPVFDQDQLLFFPENKDLIKRNVVSLSTSKETLKIYPDKEIMFEFLNQNGFLTPKTFNFLELNEQENYFIKPKIGVGSSNAQIIKATDIKKINNIDEYLIQEVLKKPEITLEVFCDKNSISTVTRQRIETKSGVCTKAKIYHDKNLEKIAFDFINTIKTPQIFNLQFMKDSNDKYVITDINFRFAAGTSLSCEAGWDAISALLNRLLGEDNKKVFRSLVLNSKEQWVVRAYSDIVTRAKT